ncbi:hypothetical protein Q8A67_018628 [Cirrhinus molitorella]|uniref:Uncharacterized protein n=1 Tax=Cirrhinus molitorella TaxID=172907 RepID=A0AA88PCH9_9TELE|nr:hypothetical protein Q8A67_018628 [Cirrhinus molitorella]
MPEHHSASCLFEKPGMECSIFSGIRPRLHIWECIMMQQARKNSHTVVAVTDAAKPDCSASPVLAAKR